MSLTSHIVSRENNVVRVDFGRGSDPPAPKFPGANGLRPVEWEERTAVYGPHRSGQRSGFAASA